jgi:hypothetical protein
MANNLWQIVNFDDLIRLLREGENKFTVLAIFTSDTSDSIRIMMRKLMKEKSKIYPKVTFLIYKAVKSDFGKLMPIFEKDETQYPKLVHIYNMVTVMAMVNSIDNREILEKDFKDFHEYYLKGCNQIDEGSESEDEDTAVQQSDKKQNKVVSNKNRSDHSVSENVNQDENVISNTLDPELERQKHQEKLKLLAKKQKECMYEFIKECGKRKETEEKDNKKAPKKTKN